MQQLCKIGNQLPIDLPCQFLETLWKKKYLKIPWHSISPGKVCELCISLERQLLVFRSLTGPGTVMSSLQQALKKLEDLYESGVLSTEDLEARKAALPMPSYGHQRGWERDRKIPQGA